MKFLANQGWEEAQAIKESAGARGSIVHQASELLEKSGKLPIETPFIDPNTRQSRQLSSEELECLLSFTRWHKEINPLALATEMTIFGNYYGGTLDRIYRIGDQIFITDLKTSKQIWQPMLLQLSAYSHACIDYKALGISDEDWKGRKLAILQLGYQLNKKGFKWTEIDDCYELFGVAYKIWQTENPNDKPKEREIPLVLTIKQGEKNGQHIEAK